ncbi:MAG: NADH-quinone oxidoreductase subunit N [Elusimicrobia bacterium]|nr:NADH-quinone oxidoreductase subunit N [Elusimicrobiota bacterium]
MQILAYFFPEIWLATGALALLTIDFMKPKARRTMTAAAYLAVAGALICIFCPWWEQGMGILPFVFDDFSLDGLTLGFTLLILTGTLVTIALAQEDETLKPNWGSFLGLLVLASLGCVLLVKARDFVYAFLAIELISISSFILVAFERRELAMIEGALKYFLVGAFSSAIALYGISLCYAATGTTGFGAIAQAAAQAGDARHWLATTGLLLVLVSFGFKASIAPFHFWVPDAYQAAPTPFTAYLSVVPKLAALGVLVALTSATFGLGQAAIHAAGLTKILAVLAVLTMTVGNVSAIHQNDLKRLLAYSSIAQAGYMMIGILAATKLGGSAVLLYGFAYLLMNLGAFACVFWVAKQTDSYDITACDGLAVTHLPFALTFTAFLLSLAGIPPLVGFLGKYLVFASALDVGWAWPVAVAGVLNSVISVYYYLRIAYRMFFVENRTGAAIAAPQGFSVLVLVIVLMLIGTISLGIYPKPLLALVQ